MRSLLLILFSLLCNMSIAQFKEFDIKQEIENKNSNTIIYLTAVWCKPCMDELPNIIDSFKNISSYKLVVWFERGILDTLQKMLIKKYGDNLFYLFPKKYYVSFRKKLLVINMENKVLKKIMKDINVSSGLSLTWDDMGWGKLILINREKVVVAKGIKKGTQIKEILSYIQ